MGVALLDVDGTLVDTNYHHALAWFRALRENGVVRPVWVIHRHIGMGGDQLVKAVADAGIDAERGDQIRADESSCYMEMIGEVQPMERSRELIEELRRRGHRVVLASSAKEEEVDHYLDLLDARELANDWTTSGDVEATKPAPDLVESALSKAGASPQEAVLIGDSTWDVEAAHHAGVGSIAVMTGGFGRDELLEAGAASVFESVAELLERLEETALA